MKKIKHIGAVIFALTMLLSLSLTGVTAATDATGRDPEKNVSLTVFKYEHNEEIKFPISDGSEIDPKDIPTEAKPVEGVIFKIEKVTLKKEGVEEPINDPKNYEPVTGEGEFSTTGITDKNGKVVFSTDSTKNTAATALVDQGIYKITEIKQATVGTAAIADFIVSLPMANPDTKEGADPWLYDVFAYPKNDINDTIEKEIDPGGTIGNIITWKYSVIIPSDLENSLTGKESLVITDTLDSRLTYVTDSIEGTYTNKDSEALKLDRGKDYTIDDTGKSTDNAQELIISITADGFKKLQAATTGTGSNNPMMYFTFKTSTNITNTNDLGKIENGGEFDYTNSAGHVYDKENVPEKSKIDVYGIKINKININNEVLGGASFNLYTDEAAANDKDTTKALKKPNSQEIWTVTTDDENGYADLNGLVEGTYYLVETQAPKGYQPLTEPITVVINADTQKGDVTVTDSQRSVSITVTNNKGFSLPVTGDMGIILFTTGGLVLIGTATALLILSKRKRTKK